MRKTERKHPLNQSPFFKLRSRKKLADLLGFTPEELQETVATRTIYKERLIETKKPNGTIKLRLTQEPRRSLRNIHERVKRLLSRIEPPGFLFCPVKRRSYVSNAATHAGAAEIRTLDVKDYFTSTLRRRVFYFFNSVMGCEPDVASMLAHLLTFNGHVPTGSPVSPILCFFAFYEMWHEIADAAISQGCKITVYMDDLTVSGEVVPEWLMWQVRQTIHRQGLRYHKERRFTGGFGEVTGVVLRDGKTILPNRQRKRAHEISSQIQLLPEGEEKATLQRRLIGLNAQRKQVEAV
jgi:retron-type reverse transcriptase